LFHLCCCFRRFIKGREIGIHLYLTEFNPIEAIIADKNYSPILLNDFTVVNLEDEEDISTPYTSQKNEKIYTLITGDLLPTHENTGSLLKGYLNSKKVICR
jgi:hypothetical protein